MCDLEIWWMTSKKDRALLLYYVKLCASFQIHQITVQNRSIRVEIGDILSRVTFKLDGRPWKTIGHLFCTTSCFVHHFKSISEVKLELQSGSAQFGSKLLIFLVPGDIEIWWMTLKNNRASLLSNIKLCASFHHHMWIQTGVTVRKRLNGVITPENLMMIQWWEHSEKGVTDRRTDGQTERSVLRAAWWQLKIKKSKYLLLSRIISVKQSFRWALTKMTMK